MNCTFKNCRKVADIIYLDQAYCNEHWQAVCNQQEKEKEKLKEVKNV